MPTAHWAKKNDIRLIWQQGHTERRGKDPNKWTNDEWANREGDRLAGRAWEEAFSQVQNQANAPRFRHAGGIQVITPEGSITGRISKRLPELLTTERGLPALQMATQLSDKAMELLDDEATLQGAKHFGVTMYSVSHWAKFYTHHWYTESRACKFKQAESAECKCCRDEVNETTARIFQCTDRNEVHLEHHQKLTALLADQQLPNRLLHIIEAGIDLALLSDITHQGETWDGDDDGNEIKKRVAQLLNNDEINTEFMEEFRQQTIIGWKYIFTGKFAKGWRKCWTEPRQWATKFAILMMT